MCEVGAEGGVEGSLKEEVCHVLLGSRAMGAAQGMCPSGSGCLAGGGGAAIEEAHAGQNQSPGGGSGRGGSKQWQCHAMSQESQMHESQMHERCDVS